MKLTALLALPVLGLAAAAVSAAEPLLAIPGKVILDAPLDKGVSEPFKPAKGKWEASDGALRGSELASDNHGAVMRANQELADFIIEVEVKLDGAKTTTLSVNAKKDHMARVLISPTMVAVQRDDNDHEGPDKAVVFHRVKADIKPGEWHKVRMEMVGDTMLGQVDGITGWGSNDLFKQARFSPGVTVAGQSVLFRNFKIYEATKNPKWDEIKGTIKNEVAPAPAAAGAAKGKGKAKAKAKGAEKSK